MGKHLTTLLLSLLPALSGYAHGEALTMREQCEVSADSVFMNMLPYSLHSSSTAVFNDSIKSLLPEIHSIFAVKETTNVYVLPDKGANPLLLKGYYRTEKPLILPIGYVVDVIDNTKDWAKIAIFMETANDKNYGYIPSSAITIPEKIECDEKEQFCTYYGLCGISVHYDCSTYYNGREMTEQNNITFLAVAITDGIKDARTGYIALSQVNGEPHLTCNIKYHNLITDVSYYMDAPYLQLKEASTVDEIDTIFNNAIHDYLQMYYARPPMVLLDCEDELMDRIFNNLQFVAFKRYRELTGENQ